MDFDDICLRASPDAEAWARRWQSGCASWQDMVAGRLGDQKFPEAEKRQHQLIGRAIDAALATGLCQSLIGGAAPERIEGKFLDWSSDSEKAIRSEAFHQDVKAIRRKHLSPRDEANEMVALVLQLVKEGCVRNHRGLVPDGSWDNYLQQRKEAHEVYADYYHRHDQWKKTQDQWHEKQMEWETKRTEWEDMGQHGTLEPPPAPPHGKPPAVPYIEANPNDPRRLACNDLVGNWITIPESNIKSPQSIARKIHNKHVKIDPPKNGSHIAAKLRDINRLSLIPRTPAIAKHFFTFLEAMNPAKETEAGAVPRLLIEGWQVKTSGHFDHKAFLALDQLESHERSNGSTGMVCEIKTIGEKMKSADYLTAPIYDALKDLNSTRRYIPSGNNEKPSALAAREALRKLLERSQRRFAERCAETFDSAPYHFPEIPKEEAFSRPETYNNLAKALVDLCYGINTDMLNREKEGMDWKRAYLYTAMRQNELCSLGKSGVKLKEPEEPNHVETTLLRRIDVDRGTYEAIRKAAKAQVADEYMTKKKKEAIEEQAKKSMNARA